MADNDSPETNSSLQADEVEAMSAIYGDDWKTLNASHGIFAIVIGEGSPHRLHLQLTLPPSYPMYSSPKYHFISHRISNSLKDMLTCTIKEICRAHIGESVLYLLIEKLREILQNFQENESKESVVKTTKSKRPPRRNSLVSQDSNEELKIEHGEVIIDQKSIFQGHACAVKSVEKIDQVLSKLKEYRKIATATHNIVAYRIYHEKKGIFLQDFDEDGEHKAGPPLLHLLQVLNVENVVVVVTRWFGGKNLGSDRFKHINNAARNVLESCGYVKKQEFKGKKAKDC